ncbi:MAG TPA: enoyl-CoA hydratase [Acetobacteraceae bacterium]|nr:enoyl-CoA hydratase [Acetobacteraceae bacterium]
MSDTVVLTRDGAVLEIRLNRPEKKNALTRAMYDAMADAFAQVDADPTLHVALLTGTGDSFTSGNDIADFQARAANEGEASSSRFLPGLASMRKPLIAAVNGNAIGVGTTMLMHCDLIVAARSARFVMPFTSLGLVPEAASSLLFPRLLGHQRAAALLLLGEPLDAATAHEWGFVNRVVDDADLMRVAHDIARRLAALPTQAVQSTKHLMRHGAPDVTGRIKEELALFRERLGSPEAAEAFRAFMERRRPVDKPAR